jgi:hypothetical protein
MEKSTPNERIAKIVGPDDIDEVFRSLGATKAALDLSAEVIPQSTSHGGRISLLHIRQVLLFR